MSPMTLDTLRTPLSSPSFRSRPSWPMTANIGKTTPIPTERKDRSRRRVGEDVATLPPCKFHLPDSPSKRSAVAGRCPSTPRSSKTVCEPGTPPAVPSNPNSRRGRTASSLRQGRVAMEKITVGIDVSKDHLDVAVRPSGEQFAVPRTGAGLDELVARVRVLKPNLIVIEATGGFETVVVAVLAAAGLHWKVRWFFALEDAINISCSSPELVDNIRPIGDQSAGG